MFDGVSKNHKKNNLALNPQNQFLSGEIKASFVESLVSLASLENKRILDLSRFSVKKFNSFSQLGFTNIHFTDFFDSAEASIFTEDGSLTQSHLFDICFSGLSEKKFKKFDVVLCWDILNFLPPVNLKLLTDFLFEHTTNSANLYAFVYTSNKIPDSPVGFELDMNKRCVLVPETAVKLIEAHFKITSKQLQNFFAPWYLNKISLCHGSIHDVHFTK